MLVEFKASPKRVDWHWQLPPIGTCLSEHLETQPFVFVSVSPSVREQNIFICNCSIVFQSLLLLNDRRKITGSISKLGVILCGLPIILVAALTLSCQNMDTCNCCPVVVFFKCLLNAFLDLKKVVWADINESTAVGIAPFGGVPLKPQVLMVQYLFGGVNMMILDTSKNVNCLLTNN